MLFCVWATASGAQQYAPSLYSGLRWRLIGPFRGGRALTASGVPGDRETYYFGAVAGGVWKTTNSGQTWEPVFDSQPIASIGALAIAPSDPNVIYVGTGEASIRSDITFGNGVYKSTDAGGTWKHVGLEDTRCIGRVLVDPHDANIVFVAALGHAYGPNAQRGVFRSSDGGQTWQKVLYKDENTGAIDLAFDPDDARIVYATLWNARRPAWSAYAPLQGPGSGLYKSADGGLTWTPLTGHGLPPGDWGRVGMATAKGRGISRVYALIDALNGRDSGLYRSDDGGANWARVSADRRIYGRQWYFGEVTVDPKDPDVVYIPNVALYRSLDGGKTFTAIKGAPGGDDYHFLWIDPGDSRRMIVASDQGTVISVDGGQSWSSWYNQPTAQFYHVATDNQFPYYVYGAQQDSGTMAIASATNYGQITFRDWYSVGAGESGYIAPHPADPDVVYGGSTYGELFRFTKPTGQSLDISPSPIRSFGSEISQRKLRFTWTSPVAFSPQDSRVLYMGAQYVLRSADGGMSWQTISPDLTGADPKAPASGPLTVENAKARGYGVVYTIAPSPLAAGEIWAGSDTGLIHLTRDGGKTWSNVTPPGLPEWSKISLLEASHFDPGAAYAAVDRHRLDDYAPYIYRTHDYGKSWEGISRGIGAPAFVRAVREDPERKGLLFAGTETGVYVSFDDGDHWQPLQLNLSAAPIHDLVIKGNDLVVATHGRSFWILDDITPLRQLTPEVARATVHLFRPQIAVRMRTDLRRDTPLPPETPAAQNPPDGAILDYYLASAPLGAITLEVLDSAGKLVRRFSSDDPPEAPPSNPPFATYWIVPPAVLPRAAGLNRFVWNLRYPSPPALSRNYEIAAVYGRGVPALPRGPLALPGQYQVRLTVNGASYTQPLTISPDPRLQVSADDLRKQFDLETAIAAAISQDYEALSRLRNLRTKLKASRQQLPPSAGAALAAVDRLDRDAGALEGDRYRVGDTLPGLLGSLSGLLSVVDSADHAPTTQAQESWQELRRRLGAVLTRWEEIQRSLPELNKVLTAAGLAPVTL